jgi:integrase/recombinase XerD
MTLQSVLAMIPTLQNQVNAGLINDWYSYMTEQGNSESYRKTNVKIAVYFAKSLRPELMTFWDIKKKEQITTFLNTKIKSKEEDPEETWITTWNDYCERLTTFFRWLYNVKLKEAEPEKILPRKLWTTPEFCQIPEKTTKRVSPYSATEIWERDDVLFVLKYEPHPRNKAMMGLLWDLDARNHEVAKLKIKNIRFKKNYAEGEIPYNTKTGGGAFVLSLSFPYVRDWYNQHPFRTNPEAPFIPNLNNGKHLSSEGINKMMKLLKARIENLLKAGAIKDDEEREKLLKLLSEKRWNPYCVRHSAISHDSDYLPGYALNKKVRWTMNSKQPNRYIKNRMSNDLKSVILAYNGIIAEEVAKPKAAVIICPKCQQPNSLSSKFCTNPKCTSYPLSQDAYEEQKKEENEMKQRITELEAKLAKGKEDAMPIIMLALEHLVRTGQTIPVPPELHAKMLRLAEEKQAVS